MLHHGILFSYFHKERMFVLIKPFVRKYDTEREEIPSEGYCKNE